MTLKRLLQTIILSLGLLALLWLIGLISFTNHIKALVEESNIQSLPPTDAIVVLTGGSERVNVGLELLQAGKAQKLFISGVHPGLTFEQLTVGSPFQSRLYRNRVALGHEAESTMGNAEETLAWMKLEGFHSMRLVTANYHMARSLLIFHTAMPEMTIIAHPISPDSVMLDNWWTHPGTASLLVTEFDKYLWAVFRLELGSP